MASRSGLITLPVLRVLSRTAQPLRRHASSKPITEKTRILEKPSRFNPPSHPARRPRTRRTYGPSLTTAEVEAQATRKYPNMMPPKGSFMHWFLTNRALHLWITLGTLTSLACYTLLTSFVTTTPFRDQLPYGSDFLWHPFQSIGQAINVYKIHTDYQSEKVAEMRRQKLEDVSKRREFMRAHGVEPGFLTGGWMERFGTVEGDRARELVKEAERGGAIPHEKDPQSPIAPEAGGAGSEAGQQYKPKRWLGIW